MPNGLRHGDTTHTVDGHELVKALQHYSETGMKYVTLLYNIMRHYHLKALDSVHLDNTDALLHISFR